MHDSPEIEARGTVDRLLDERQRGDMMPSIGDDIISLCNVINRKLQVGLVERTSELESRQVIELEKFCLMLISSITKLQNVVRAFAQNLSPFPIYRARAQNLSHLWTRHCYSHRSCGMQ